MVQSSDRFRRFFGVLGARKLGLLAIIILLVGVALAFAPGRRQLPEYQLAEVSRGEAVTKVIAAGTVQPVVSVVVGSQVSGQVKEILVDHNDQVKQGQPIALLDPEIFNTRVEQARAEVDVASEAVRIAREEVSTAEAVVTTAIAERAKAEADSRRYQVMIELTHQRLDRKSVLMKSGAVSTSDADDARAAYETALADSRGAAAQVASQEARVQETKAQLAVVGSRVAHAEAQIRQRQAMLHQAEADLDRTVIRAPMSGIVIDRSIAAGQTVAASFQAPTLFTIGDLHSVNVEIAVDEADIGELRLGQHVTFSVDAYPDKTFTAQIVQIRKSPHVQETVVTYTVVAAANNDDFLLFPGMTAKAEIVVGDVPDALQVPSAALRYEPKNRRQPVGSHVWVFYGTGIRPVTVRVGVSNEGKSEITDGDLVEGEKVIIADRNEAGNPVISRIIGALPLGRRTAVVTKP